MLSISVFNYLKKWFQLGLALFFSVAAAQAGDVPFNHKDTSAVNKAIEKSYEFLINDQQDSSFFLINKAYSASQAIDYQYGIARSLYVLGLNDIYLSDLDKAIEKILASRNIFEAIHSEQGITDCLMQIGVAFYTQKKFKEAIPYFRQALPRYLKSGNIKSASTITYLLGLSYSEKGDFTEAESFLLQAEKDKKNINDQTGEYEVKTGLGNLYNKTKRYEKAKIEFAICYDFFRKQNNKQAMAYSLFGIGNAFENLNNDSCLNFFKQALIVANESMNYDIQINASEKLKEYYKNKQDDKNELYYLKMYDKIKEKVFNENNSKTIANLQYNLDLEKKQSEINLLNNKRTIDKFLRYALVAGIILLLVISISWYKRYSFKRETNLQLVKMNKELETTLQHLKSAQEQLVQSEKLASLGQLTAGIAHEIRNPLNFVNNFSQVSKDLVNELVLSSREEEKREIGDNLKSNLEKIIKHGLRADNIVQNMLEHSRSNSGEKQSTDINRLCDEYLNFALIGIKVVNPTFTCELKKHFDSSLPKINIVQQEISRVILNLSNNAFYAVAEKQKTELEKGNNTFNPQVIISTSALNRSVFISIRDNGTGFPDQLKDKIFNPFFTTKPAGEGTGLGLSISFEIIKAHGGEIKVISRENEFTEFTIMLPS